MTTAEPPRRPARTRNVPAEETSEAAPPPPAPEARPEPPETPPHPLPLGRVAFGLILLAVGVGWLLHSLDVIDVPWDALLPVALIAIGAVLVVGSRTGRYSGLIALGIVLTLTTALVSAVDVPLIGGAGQRVISPQSVAELEPRYDLAVGQMVIDLRELQLPPRARVDVAARVGMGELVVHVPAGLTVTAHGRAGLGDIQVLGEEASGIGPERTVLTCPAEFDPCDETQAQLVLDLSVGLGEVQVSQ